MISLALRRTAYQHASLTRLFSEYRMCRVPTEQLKCFVPMMISTQRIPKSMLSSLEVYFKQPAQPPTGNQSSVPSADSWLHVRLPLSNPAVKADYQLFHTKFIRVGKVMEDLDAFAGDVAYRFADQNLRQRANGSIINQSNAASPNQVCDLNSELGFQSNVTIVTAAVDRINFIHTLNVDSDLIIEGFVSWVGRSSMEITLELSFAKGTQPDGEREFLGRAFFLMVARDSITYQATKLPLLLTENADEKLRFVQAQHRRDQRLALANRDLRVTGPRADESALIHDLFLRSKQLLSPNTAFGFQSLTQHDLMQVPEEVKNMVSIAVTRNSTTLIMHSQNRNIHGKIFGGFLMRQALEIAWTNAYLFSGHPPHLLVVDDINFIKPVEIGTVVHMHALTAFCDPASHSVVVAVAVEMQNLKSRELSTTNTFYFTFKCHHSPNDAFVPSFKPSLPSITSESLDSCLPQLIPRSYEEAMLYLRARRVLQSNHDQAPSEVAL